MIITPFEIIVYICVKNCHCDKSVFLTWKCWIKSYYVNLDVMDSSYESKCTYGSNGVGLTVIWLWNYYGKYYISKGVTMKMGMKIGCDLIALLKFLSEVYVARIGNK